MRALEAETLARELAEVFLLYENGNLHLVYNSELLEPTMITGVDKIRSLSAE
jgi:hypothetical protein